MSLTAQPRWKEEIVVGDEAGQSFVVDCGWGVDPPVAYVPSMQDWKRCMPAWLWERRDELIEVLRGAGHVVHEGPYPALHR